MLECFNEFDELHAGRMCRRRKIDTLYNCGKGGGLGGIVGKVTDFAGITDYKGQEQASDAAKSASQSSTDAAKAATKIASDQLSFSKQQYADWQGIYGDTQKNLADYYENLSGDTLASQQLSTNAREYAAAYKLANQQLAQRGLSNSGAAAAVDTAMNIQNATTRAQIRATSDQQANMQKAGFLQLGLGQQATLLGNIGTASNSLMQGYGQQMLGYTNQANLNQQNYQMLAKQNQETMSSLTGGFAKSDAGGAMGSSITGAIGSLMSFSDTRLKRNIKFIGINKGYNIYSWDWNDLAHSIGASGHPTTGVLAQELLHTDAISKDITGYYMVDYSKLGVK